MEEGEKGDMNTSTHYRAIFISDIHLATRGCKAEYLLDFLRHHECDTIYLVGDIVDGWRMRRGLYWPQAHNDVVQKLLRRARKGTRVIYLPGNHDEGMRGYLNMNFGGVRVMNRTVHRTVDGRKLLVMHGDQLDAVVMSARWLALLGERAYVAALGLNELFNAVRRRLGFPYWSLSNYLKQKVKHAMEFVSDYRLTLVQEAVRRGVDGVVCGHLHRAEICNVDGVMYYNTGDWVESCTALVEHHDGRMEIVEWAKAVAAAEAGKELAV